MNQAIRDNIVRLARSIANDARANDLRLAEQAAIVSRERTRADTAERQLAEALAVLQTEYVVFKTGREAPDDADNI